MNAINNLKGWVGALTDLGLTLLALGIVCALLVGGAQEPYRAKNPMDTIAEWSIRWAGAA